MSPTTQTRNHPGAFIVMGVIVISIALSRHCRIAETDMLANENVIQLLGVILAGQLAVLALSVPALFEIREKIERLELTRHLVGMTDYVFSELRSNTLWSFFMFAATFLMSIVAEAYPGCILASLPFGFDSGMLFAAAKLAFVTLSCLAMWDSVEPLFALGESLAVVRSLPTENQEHEEPPKNDQASSGLEKKTTTNRLLATAHDMEAAKSNEGLSDRIEEVAE